MMDFEEMRNAHNCDIWALWILCGSVVVIFALMILQIKCKSGISNGVVICDRTCVICRRNVDLGGAV